MTTARTWNVKVLVGIIVAAAVIGVALDLTRDGVTKPVSDIAAEPGSFKTRAAFCPPPFSQRFGTQTVAVAADPGSPASIRIQPQESENSDLPEGRLLMQRIEGPAIEAVGYDAVLHAAALIASDKPVTGSGAARCPRVVSEKWYFPAGSSSLGYDERILVRNPFPDEAVVTVTFFTPTGKTIKANLAEVAVPAGQSKFIQVNDFILRQPVLGAAVTAQRGRIVAWRVMFAESEDRPNGVYFELGATSPSEAWYFPEGQVGGGIEEVITLLNPNRREAIVTISLATRSKPVQPPKLVEVKIAPGAVKAISLPQVLSDRDQDLGGVGAIVRSTNDVEVVAERTVWYAADRTGVASSIGAREPVLQWVVPPAAVASVEDSLVLLNPSDEKATVSLQLFRQGGDAITPENKITVPARGRVGFSLSQLSGGQPAAVLVSSDVPIVAERVASTGNGDVSSVMGDPTRSSQLSIE